MRPLISVFLFTVSLLTANAAMSDMSVTEYEGSKTDKKEWPATQLYLEGVGVGATLVATAMTEQSKPSLFCQPEEIELNQKSYIKLVDALIAKNDIPDDTPVETVLIMALAVAFPCN